MVKKLAVFLGIPLVVVITLIAFLPTLISTPLGQHFALKLLERQLPESLRQPPTTLTIQKLQVAWFGPQKIEQISFINPEKGIDLSCEAIEVSQSLFSLAFASLSPSTIAVEHLKGHVSDLKALEMPPNVIKILGNEISITLHTSPEKKYNRLVAHLQSPQATAEFDGRFEPHKKKIELPGTLVFNSPEKFSIQDLQLNLSEISANQIHIQLSGTVQHQQKELTQFFGPEFTVKATTTINQTNSEEAPQPILVSITNAHTAFKFAANLLHDGRLQLTQDATFNYEFFEKQNKALLTLEALLHSPKAPIQLDNWQNSELTGAIVLKNQQAKSILAADFEVELNNTHSGDESQFIDFHLHNSDAYLKLKARVNEDMLTLRSPLFSEINVNTWLAQPELANLFPLNLIHSTSAPLKLSIAPEEFQLPLDFNLKNLRVSSMQLDLGMFALKREGPLTYVAKHFDAPPNGPLSVQFTPALLSIQDGIAMLYRLDVLLLNLYPIALWGKTDFIEDQLDITVGIPADSLAKFYELPFLKGKELFAVPIIGQVKSPTVDISKLELKLDSLAKGTAKGKADQSSESPLEVDSNAEAIPLPTSAVPWANLLASPENGNK